MMEYRVKRDENYLAHYGVKGQKHGVRQYQNEDGSLTNLGREHYGVGQGGERLGKKNRYEYSDGSLTKAGIRERSRMEKWSNGTSRRIARNSLAVKRGHEYSDADLYGMYKASRATMVGTLLAGPLVGITAGLVSNHRFNKSGREFANKFFNG